MFKKVTIKIVIILASILLVAHAIIPHLHFNAEVIITSELELSHANHNHNPSDPNDQCEHNIDSCILKQVFLVRSENLIPNYCQLLSVNKSDNIQGFHAIINTLNFDFILFPVLSPHSKEKLLLYSYFYCGNINSRGSPVV